MTERPALEITRQGAAVVLTFCRGDRANALSRVLVDALWNALHELRNQTDVRAVVITGEGDRAFCAGADLKERADMDDAQVRAFVGQLQGLMTAIEDLPIPVIAAINGAALGGGLELAMACDLRIAADHALLGLPEVRLAIIPGAGGTQRLPRLVGPARARELIFTGRRLTASQAETIGLVNCVTAPDALLPTALAWTDEIALGGPVAIAQAKFALRCGADVDLATGLALERKAYELVIPTADRREALAAFADKRAPRFEGR